MERKVNETFKDQSGKMVKAVLADKPETCFACCYSNCKCWKHRDIIGDCIWFARSDNQDVIFKEETE